MTTGFVVRYPKRVSRHLLYGTILFSAASLDSTLVRNMACINIIQFNCILSYQVVSEKCNGACCIFNNVVVTTTVVYPFMWFYYTIHAAMSGITSTAVLCERLVKHPQPLAPWQLQVLSSAN